MRGQAFSGEDRGLLTAVSALCFDNPFGAERVAHEREALGAEFDPEEALWSLDVEAPERQRENAWRIAERIEDLVRRNAAAVAAEKLGSLELAAYEDAVFYLLFYRHGVGLDPDFEQGGSIDGERDVYAQFLADWHRCLGPYADRTSLSPEHVFALYFQIHRAFLSIFHYIIGSSRPAARLRASVWESVFTCDMHRYRRTLFARMGDFATLITGPSGTGKELTARAIAAARYVPFDAKARRFAEAGTTACHAVNLAALSPTLIESELFGHAKGAFTGAAQDRKGWLETCPERGTVFLDELGELEPAIQVKLLRVIEARRFQRVGETRDREFVGKLVAATNRDLAAAMAEGAFREDLYYRLCSDQVGTVTLREQLDDQPEVLRELVLFMAKRVAGPEAEGLAEEAFAWIEANLGAEYGWPGNYRELEQCVRNILIRREYRPPGVGRPREVFAGLEEGAMTAEELVRRYCTLVYARTGSYEETGRRLGLDRRTVKARVDMGLLGELRGREERRN